MIQLKVIDREAIIHLVQDLEDFEKDKALRSGLSSAGEVFVTGGKRRLKNGMKNPNGKEGNLLRAFLKRVKKSKPGALAGFDYEVGPHAHFIDRGTQKRYIKSKSNKYAGAGPALEFWEDTRNQDYPKAIDRLYNGVDRAVRRINERRKQ